MKVKIFITLFILSCVFLQNILAQDRELKFNLVVGNNAEPLGQINAITQDPMGYMWFSGTQKNCIYRYDGIRMISFRHDSLNENSLGSIRSETVYADSAGMIWIGFYDGGLDRYNPATGIFKHYRNNPKDPASLSAGLVSVILRDHKGNLWVGTQNGLDRLDDKTGRFIHYRNEPGNPSSLSNNFVRSILEDRKGVLWIGTGFEFDPETPNEGGLNRMEADGVFTRFKHDPKNPNSLANNKVRALFEDSRGIFWIGTAGNDGLYTLDREKNIFTRYIYNPAKPESLCRPPVNNEFDPITFIKEDGTGAIWIGTNTSGINRYDTSSGKITHYESSNGYPDKGCFAAYTSRDGVMWVGSYEVTPFLYRVDPSLNIIKNTNLGSVVNSMLEDKHRFLWVGVGRKGLFQLDQNKNIIQRFKNNESDSLVLSNITIYSMFQNQPDTLWLNTSRGVLIFQIPTGRFSRLLYKPKPDSKPEPFTERQAFQMIQDKSGLKWFATTNGLYSYNASDQSLKAYLPDAKDTSSISSSNVNTVLEDDRGNIWIGVSSNGAGINLLNKATGSFKHYIPGIITITLYEDAEKTIWAGTVQGLYKYDRAKDVFSPFFGQVSTSLVNGIMEDDQRNLWIAAESAIMKLNADRTHHFIYDRKYGLREGSLLYSGICKNSVGEILVGNPDGFYIFSPNDTIGKSKPLQITITGFFVNNREFFMDKKGPLTARIEKTDEIHVKNNQNNLSFRYAVMDYHAPEAIRYFTMLENYDDVWREALGDKIATFINVPPGKYVFRIESFNVDGIKSEKSLTIIIDPPWWKTWWAYAIYGLLIVVFSVFMNRMLRERAVRQERLKAQAKELEQAKEIEKAYTELKATQTQLIQSEKMASLGELTAGIAHEIQNPLNFVNNFSEVNRELLEEMNREIEKGNMDEVKTIAKAVTENEGKIIHHGKRADAIVKGMLQHSRVSGGQKEPTELNALVDEYLRLSYHGLRAKDKSFNAKMQTDYDDSIGSVQMIPQDMGRVFLNLFNNAFYAVSQKAKTLSAGYEPLISVSTKKISDKIVIRVKDNGTGISSKVIDKIFQPFFTTKPTGQGTGLGLSMSYDIIKAHGGELQVNGNEGQGAEFRVVIPVG